MPRNGSGVYGLPAGTAAVPNTTIESAKYNSVNSDVAQALTDSVNVQGTAPFQANQPMGGNKLTGLGAGTVSGDSISLGQAQSGIVAHAATVAGTVDAITAAFSPPFTAWTAKMRFRFTAGAANTVTNPTANVDGLGAKTIKKLNGAALAIGDIAGNGHICECLYDGTDVILLNPALGFGGGQSVYTAKQTFSGPLITTVTTLIDAPTIAWDMSMSSNDVKIILSASRNLGLPTNIQTGMKGLLVIEQNAIGGWSLIPNAVFDLSGDQTAFDLDKTANAQTFYQYQVIVDAAGAQKIRINKIYATGWNSIGHFIEYDLGLYSTDATLEITHNLGRYPSHATIMAQCVATDFNYSVGDRVFPTGGPYDTDSGGGGGNGNGYGWCLAMSTTKVFAVLGFLNIRDKVSHYTAGAAIGRWRIIVRIYL